MPSLVIHRPTMSSWTNREITNHHLLPYVDSETATPEVAQALHTLPFQRNIFKLLANAPAMMPAFMKLLSTCWSEERTIRSKEWQIAVLRTAWLNNAPYEWGVNEPVAACFGLEMMILGPYAKVTSNLGPVKLDSTTVKELYWS